MYGRKVQKNCHVAYRRNYYSVSHLAVGKTVDLRVTDATLEVFLGGERLATHPAVPGLRAQPLLDACRRPPEGRSYSDWDAGAYAGGQTASGRPAGRWWTASSSAWTNEEQGFNAALAVLRLEHRYTRQRLERACGLALASGGPSPRYRHLKPILETNQDLVSPRACR